MAMIPLNIFAGFVLKAQSDPKLAAVAFLSAADERLATLMIDVAGWRDTDVADFEKRGLAVLIEGSKFGGRFWLASPLYSRVLLPPAPRLAPSHLVALARAVVDAILVGWDGSQKVRVV